MTACPCLHGSIGSECLILSMTFPTYPPGMVGKRSGACFRLKVRGEENKQGKNSQGRSAEPNFYSGR